MKLEQQLRTCSTKIKLSLPPEIKKILPYPLVVKGIKTKNKEYFIQMQMYKSQYENPIKTYHWKYHTNVREAIEILAIKFVEEYKI